MKLPIEGRKKYVILLLKKDIHNRQIAQELGMSSRNVDKILKESEREEREAREIEAKEKEAKEKERLFSSNRSEA